ncbi:putative cytoplasmic protein (plasmid) [Salmonella enterica]|nr:putative cytoplasmic protein [Salmonella enterica]
MVTSSYRAEKAVRHDGRRGGRLSARAKKPAGWRLRGEGQGPRFAPLPALFPLCL